MHSYIRAIGFSEFVSKKKTNELIELIIKNSDKIQKVKKDNGDEIIEIQKEFGKGFGIIVHGTIDEHGEIDVEYYFPYVIAKTTQSSKEILIEKQIAQTSFAGVCDDLRVGVSLIFYMQNTMDYLDYIEKNSKIKRRHQVKYAALSVNGTILFPINKSESEIMKDKVDLRKRTNLIAAAREGDEDALETLTIEDLDTYTKISRRILKEDVFTIVETSFMPYGVECDQYNVVGEIINVEKLRNEHTQEEVYVLTVSCNDFSFEIGINKSDLLGEPKVGRRFKGPVWLQGYVKF